MRPKKILIVDDEPYILRILSFKLRLANYVPIEAESGEEALERIKAERPDLVLLDVSLATKLSGFDVCRLLKDGQSTRDIPVVMLTAHNLQADRALGFQLGAVDYITKPFSTRSVIQTIDSLLAPA